MWPVKTFSTNNQIISTTAINFPSYAWRKALKATALEHLAFDCGHSHTEEEYAVER